MMHARHPLPRLWLLTDERQGNALWPALLALPRGCGVIVRHYSLSEPKRRALFARIRAIASKRRLVLLLAGEERQARQWRADGSYNAGRHFRDGSRIKAVPVHNLAEIRRAERHDADFLLLSPLFATRSHPEARPLTFSTFSRLARSTYLPVIALGGVQAHHRRLLASIGAYGWAGIDAFVGKRTNT
jgi:thiamine-phosphate pyrophosphorylase